MRHLFQNSVGSVGEETTTLLRSNISHKSNYQTYNDLCSRALGSLQLITVQGPRGPPTDHSRRQSLRFNLHHEISLRAFFQINQYLNDVDSISLRACSKSIKMGLQICQPSNDSGRLMFRIDPSSLTNRLRGINLENSSRDIALLEDHHAETSRLSDDEEAPPYTPSSVSNQATFQLSFDLPLLLFVSLFCLLSLVGYCLILSYLGVLHRVLVLVGGCLILFMAYFIYNQSARRAAPQL
jgi:hypothetical protein